MSDLINGTVFEDDTQIAFIPNPKRVGCKAHARYETYQHCKTWETYKETNDKAYVKADARWDFNKGFLKIVGVEVETEKKGFLAGMLASIMSFFR